MITRWGRGRRCALVCVALSILALAGCSDDGGNSGGTAYDDAPTMSLMQVMSLVSTDARGPVSVTSWARLGHRVDGYARLATTNSWLDENDAFRENMGIGAADADWQVEFAIDAGHETITQWSDGAKLGRVVDALRKNGWRRAGAGNDIRLVRATPLDEPGWDWAHAMDFRVDVDRGVLVQYSRNRAPALSGTSTILDLAGVRASVAAASELTTGQVRFADNACPQYDLLGRSTPLPRSYVLPFVRDFGGLHEITASTIGAVDTTGRRGIAAVTMPGSELAAADLAQRKRAVAAGSVRSSRTATDGRVTGAVDLIRFVDREPMEVFEIAEDNSFGVDSCGPN